MLLCLQPTSLVSPTSVLKCQKGNCFDYSVLLCSLLIGAGYDAYCVCGYATRETTLMDETREICPLLRKKDEVSWSKINIQVDVFIPLKREKFDCIVDIMKATKGQAFFTPCSIYIK